MEGTGAAPLPGRGPRLLRADINRRADVGDRVELLREGARQADAAVAGGHARVEPGVQGDAVIVDALHPRHWRIVELLRMIHRALVEHREDACRGIAPGL